MKQVRYGKVQFPTDAKQLITQRNTIRRRLIRCRDPVERCYLNQARHLLSNQIEQVINSNINKNFRKEIKKVNKEAASPSQKLYRLSRFFKNRNKGIPDLRVDDKRLITNTEKCEALANHFSKNHELPENRRDTTERKVNSSIRNLKERPSDFVPANLFTVQEVKHIIGSLKNKKASGPDSMSNRCLKHLPPSGVLFLTDILNACLCLSYFPKCWKIANVICIRKPGKPANLADSYRPISLLSCLAKILEKLLLSRIQTFLKDRQILPSYQFGFRNGRSTVHQLARVSGKIGEHLKKRQSAGILCVDLQAAFDKVWHNGLIHKLCEIGLPVYLVKIILSFLTDRSFQVKIGNSTSGAQSLLAGVPQGAVLSPTLFNIYTSTISLF